MRAIAGDLRSRRFLARLAKEVFATIGLLAVAAGLIDALFPDAFEGYGTAVAALIATTAIVIGFARAWPRPIQCQYTAPNTVIRIVQGDLLAEAGHIVVGTCDTFDTKTPNIISRNSLQGQVLDKLYGGDVDTLDRELDTALAAENPVGTVHKAGKTTRYPIGTVAAVLQSGRRLLFLAYTEMNNRNEARGTSDGIWNSLTSLWAAASRSCNGQSLAIPVIGGGQARIAQILPAQDSIRFIAFSFMLASRREKVCDELRIVVTPDTYATLDHLELQAFLDSLQPS